jgi:hypothetical protein
MTTIYKPKDIEQMKSAISEATEIWRAASLKEFQKTGDRGSCIVGDGITVYFTPPRCRKPVELFIIRSRSVAFAQGSIHYESCVDLALNFLREKGIVCRYNHGRMD